LAEVKTAMTTHELELVATPAATSRLAQVEQGLVAAVPRLRLVRGRERVAPNSAHAPERGQWYAPALLDHLPKTGPPRLWLVDGDLYADGLNFVFGLAVRARGGVVSTARLPGDAMVVKEAVHEAGHVFGLAHCKNPCVMQFSNDLPHARTKPATFCAPCRARLDRP
jgi:archaemetzincin